jgi:hypothetical protein
MRASLKGLTSPDIRDLENWSPGDPSCFGFVLEAAIGPAGGEGAEIFQLQVCTPSWFAQQMKGSNVVSGEHTLFVARYDYPAFANFIERRCHRCEGATWTEIVGELRHLGHWEFEGYREA